MKRSLIIVTAGGLLVILYLLLFGLGKEKGIKQVRALNTSKITSKAEQVAVVQEPKLYKVRVIGTVESVAKGWEKIPYATGFGDAGIINFQLVTIKKPFICFANGVPEGYIEQDREFFLVYTNTSRPLLPNITYAMIVEIYLKRDQKGNLCKALCSLPYQKITETTYPIIEDYIQSISLGGVLCNGIIRWVWVPL